MRILVIGASGTIGSAVAGTLAKRGHDVIGAHRTSTSHPIDIADPESVQTLLDQVGDLDAVACTAGRTPYADWNALTRDDWMSGINNKLLGQIELVRRATAHVRDGGSFTVISGVLAREPIHTGTVGTAVNAAVEAWVRASAFELRDKFRINAVSPTLLSESFDAYGQAFPGFPMTSATAVAQAYVRSVESFETGQVYAV